VADAVGGSGLVIPSAVAPAVVAPASQPQLPEPAPAAEHEAVAAVTFTSPLSKYLEGLREAKSVARACTQLGARCASSLALRSQRRSDNRAQASAAVGARGCHAGAPPLPPFCF
jgi:hypothetical protein